MAPPISNHLIRNRAAAGADRAYVLSSALIGGLHRAANSTNFRLIWYCTSAVQCHVLLLSPCEKSAPAPSTSKSCRPHTPVKSLDRLDVSRRADEIHIEASARSFLHHQIRSFAGTLKLVGEGKWTPSDVADALAAKDRARCGPVAPPDGLYLVRVDY